MKARLHLMLATLCVATTPLLAQQPVVALFVGIVTDAPINGRVPMTCEPSSPVLPVSLGVHPYEKVLVSGDFPAEVHVGDRFKVKGVLSEYAGFLIVFVPPDEGYIKPVE